MRWLYFVFLYCLVTCSVVVAEEAAMEEGTDKGEEPVSEAAMMRQFSQVQGYQTLSVAGQSIDSAYLEETLGERHGVVILFHDQGEAFESNGVITPLRHRLIDYGWSTLTLSFDLPFEPNVMLSASLESNPASENADVTKDESLEAEADLTQEEEASGAVTGQNIAKNDLPPVPNLDRVEATLTMLQAKGFERVIFLGHGKGAETAIKMLKSQTLPVAGLVLVDMPKIDIDDDFKGLEVPVLEVYASQGLSDGR